MQNPEILTLTRCPQGRAAQSSDGFAVRSISLNHGFGKHLAQEGHRGLFYCQGC